MKNVFKISILILIALFMMPEDMDAQNYGKRRKKKKKKKKTEKVDERRSSGFDWKEKLWFGAGGTLGFGGNELGNTFAIGISPMVGYKFTPWLSAGPRLEANVVSGRFNVSTNEILKLNEFDYGAGVFARARTPFGLYGHIEYFVRSDEQWDGGFPADGNKLPTFRENVTAAYVGAGYNSQNGFSKWGYEIQLNYNLLAPENTVNLPIDLRFGLTYNF